MKANQGKHESAAFRVKTNLGFGGKTPSFFNNRFTVDLKENLEDA